MSSFVFSFKDISGQFNILSSAAPYTYMTLFHHGLNAAGNGYEICLVRKDHVVNPIQIGVRYSIGTWTEVAGISQLSATSRKPSGLDAAVAMREYQDIESDRFQLVAQRYEKSFLDAAKIVLDMQRDIGSVVIKAVKGSVVEEIDFKKDADLDDNLQQERNRQRSVGFGQ